MFICSLSPGKSLWRNQDALKERLKAYAELKMPQIARTTDDRLLTEVEHEVLLGTLKKIETKSAVLTTVIIFAMGALLNAVFSTPSQPKVPSIQPEVPNMGYDNYGLLTCCAALGLILPLWFAFKGISHLDTLDSRCGTDKSGPLSAVAMQQGLMDDLLTKESVFRFSWFTCRFIIIAYFILLLLDASFLFYVDRLSS